MFRKLFVSSCCILLSGPVVAQEQTLKSLDKADTHLEVFMGSELSGNDLTVAFDKLISFAQRSDNYMGVYVASDIVGASKFIRKLNAEVDDARGNQIENYPTICLVPGGSSKSLVVFNLYGSGSSKKEQGVVVDAFTRSEKMYGVDKAQSYGQALDAIGGMCML